MRIFGASIICLVNHLAVRSEQTMLLIDTVINSHHEAGVRASRYEANYHLFRASRYHYCRLLIENPRFKRKKKMLLYIDILATTSIFFFSFSYFFF